MKKLLLVLMLFICSGILVGYHQHDKECGFDETTSSGCIYEIVVQPRWLGEPPLQYGK